MLKIHFQKVTTSRNYRHSNHHSQCLHTHHDRNKYYHDSLHKNSHGRSNTHHNHLHDDSAVSVPRVAV